MPRDYSPDDVRPSRYVDDELSKPIATRYPVGMLEDLDNYVKDARANGYRFVDRSLVMRDALEAYLNPADDEPRGAK